VGEATLGEDFVRVNPGSVAGDYVKLSVGDTGVGIPPHLQPHVFEPFFTTKERGKGTGLGLATVYGIVKQLDGYITVESAVGVGTIVSIYLPVSADETTAASAVAVDGGGGSHDGERILVVEDSPHIRNVVRRALESQGYRVAIAENGAAALALLERDPHVDLVLTDWTMPRMGGAALVEELSMRADAPPVLVMTGYAHESAKGAALGRDIPLIEKPFSPKQIARRVREVLDTRVSRAPGTEG